MQSITNSYRRYALTLNKINEYAREDPEGFVKMSENAYRTDIKERYSYNSEFRADEKSP